MNWKWDADSLIKPNYYSSDSGLRSLLDHHQSPLGGPRPFPSAYPRSFPIGHHQLGPSTSSAAAIASTSSASSSLFPSPLHGIYIFLLKIYNKIKTNLFCKLKLKKLGFSGLCPCCPVKPRPLNLPSLFPSTTGLFSSISSLVDNRNNFSTGGGNMGANFHAEQPGTSSGSIEELRRKAHEHSAVFLHNLQQQAIEFHLQQQQRKIKESADTTAPDSATDWN